MHGYGGVDSKRSVRSVIGGVWPPSACANALSALYLACLTLQQRFLNVLAYQIPPGNLPSLTKQTESYSDKFAFSYVSIFLLT